MQRTQSEDVPTKVCKHTNSHAPLVEFYFSDSNTDCCFQHKTQSLYASLRQKLTKPKPGWNGLVLANVGESLIMYNVITQTQIVRFYEKTSSKHRALQLVNGNFLIQGIHGSNEYSIEGNFVASLPIQELFDAIALQNGDILFKYVEELNFYRKTTGETIKTGENYVRACQMQDGNIVTLTHLYEIVVWNNKYERIKTFGQAGRPISVVEMSPKVLLLSGLGESFTLDIVTGLYQKVKVDGLRIGSSKVTRLENGTLIFQSYMKIQAVKDNETLFSLKKSRILGACRALNHETFGFVDHSEVVVCNSETGDIVSHSLPHDAKFVSFLINR